MYVRDNIKVDLEHIDIILYIDVVHTARVIQTVNLKLV